MGGVDTLTDGELERLKDENARLYTDLAACAAMRAQEIERLTPLGIDITDTWQSARLLKQQAEIERLTRERDDLHHARGLLETAVEAMETNGIQCGVSQAWLDEARRVTGGGQ
jgi:hypothetical protein